MSEFGVFIEIIGKVATELTLIVIDVASIVLGTLFLLLSSLLPWRLIEILFDCNGTATIFTGRYRNPVNYFYYGILNLSITISDVILIPFILTTLLSPLQWYLLVHKSNNDKPNFTVMYRYNIVNVFGTLIDYLGIMLSPCILFNPYRLSVVLQLLTTPSKLFLLHPSYSILWSSNVTGLLLMEAVNTILDFFVLVPVFMLVLLCPSVWSCYFTGLSLMFKQTKEVSYNTFQVNSADKIPITSSYREFKLYYMTVTEYANAYIFNFNLSLYKFHVCILQHVLLDLLTCLIASPVLCSPLRMYALKNELEMIRNSVVDTVYDSCNDDVAVPAEIIGNNNLNDLGPHSLTYSPKDVNSYSCASVCFGDDYDRQYILLDQYRYNHLLRYKCMYYGMLSLVDIVLLPLLLPLLITWYRFAPVKEQLVNTRVWGVDEVFIVFRQAFYLLADVAVLPITVPIIYFTRYRWLPISIAAKASDGMTPSSVLYLHCCCIMTMLLLLLDVMTLPITMLLLVTRYRSLWICDILCGRTASDLLHLNFNVHLLLINNVLVLLTDACILLPAAAITSMVNCYRFSIIYGALSYHWSLYMRQPPSSLEASSTATVEVQEVESMHEICDESLVATSTSASTSSAISVEDVSVEEDDEPTVLRVNMNSIDHSLPLYEWRDVIVSQLVLMVIDIPFMVIASLLLLTLIRAPVLLHVGTKSSAMHRRYWRSSDSTACESPTAYMDIYWTSLRTAEYEMKGLIWQQFVKLCIDVVALIPFTFIVITLYKLPSLLIDIVNLFATPALMDVPIFRVEKCSILYPQNGPPTLTMTVSQFDTFIALTEWMRVGSKCRLHMNGTEFWDTINRSYSSYVSIAKSLLPLTIMDKKDTNVSEVIGAVTTCNDSVNTEVDDSAPKVYQLTVCIPQLTNVKRSTVSKKLQKLSSDCKIYLQLEGTINGGTRTIVRLAPLLSEVQALSSAATGTSLELPCERLDPTDVPVAGTNDPVDEPIDRLHVIIWLSFFTLLNDSAYMCMLLLTLLTPWRFVRIVLSMFAYPENVTYDTMIATLDCVDLVDAHVLQMKRTIATYSNRMIKDAIVDLANIIRLQTVSDDYKYRYLDNIPSMVWLLFYRYANTQYSDNNISIYPQVESFDAVDDSGSGCNTIAMFVDGVYRMTESVCASTAGCDLVAALLQNRKQLHVDLIDMIYTRAAANVLIRSAAFASTAAAADDDAATVASHEGISTALTTITLRMRNIANKLRKNRQQIQDNIASAASTRNKHRYALYNIMSSSSTSIRNAIKLNAYAACMDYVYALGLAILLLSGSRTMPLLRELHQLRSWYIGSIGVRCVISKHLLLLLSDMKIVCVFCVYFTLNCLCVLSAPSCIVQLLCYSKSFKNGIGICKKQLKRWCRYCVDLFTLFFAPKIFRVLARSVLYAFMVPGACLAEVLPKGDDYSSQSRTTLGLLLWVVMFIGSIVVTFRGVILYRASAYTANSCLLGLCLFVLFILSIGIVTSSQRHAYVRPAAASIASLRHVSWSHVFAFITGPMEAIQMIAVILYFFWHRVSGSSSSVGIIADDTNVYGSSLLLWGSKHPTEANYVDAISLCAAVVFFWGIATTIPLALHHRVSRIASVKDSGLYDVVTTMCSRLFVVWIIATLMRSSSCIQVTDDAAVLSTAPGVECGSSSSSISKVSLPLLVYYMVTCNILHSDDAHMLQVKLVSNHVTFTPLYSSAMRTCQFIMCFICFTVFNTSDLALGLLLVTCAVMILLPLAFTHDVCSISGVSFVRSIGAAAVLWSCVVCLGRQSQSNWATESALFIGFGIIAFVAVIVGVYKLSSQLASTAYGADIGAVVDRIVLNYQSSDELFTSEIIYEGSSCSSSSSSSSSSSGSDVLNERHAFIKKLKCCRSISEIGAALLSLEDRIHFDRLSSDFLVSRHEWIKQILSINDIDVTSDAVVTDAFNATAAANTPSFTTTGDPAHTLESVIVHVPTTTTTDEFLTNAKYATILLSSEVLASSIIYRCNIAAFSKSFLLLHVFKKLPEDIIYEIMTFFVDTTSVNGYSVIVEYLNRKRVVGTSVAIAEGAKDNGMYSHRVGAAINRMIEDAHMQRYILDLCKA